MSKQILMPNQFLLIADLRILHSRARELQTAMFDLTSRYTPEDIFDAVDVGDIVDTTKLIESVYDWTLTIRRKIIP